MLDAILPANEFYRRKFGDADLRQMDSLDQFQELPFTTKGELVEDQQKHPPFGTDLSFPQDRYIRIHQTSGTTGKPMYWLDTESRGTGGRSAGRLSSRPPALAGRSYFLCVFVRPVHRLLGRLGGSAQARRFGYFGRRAIHRPAAQIDRRLRRNRARVHADLCAASASEAKKAGMDLAKECAIKITIHAGEPGASIPSTKKLIEESWGAKVLRPRGRHGSRSVRLRMPVSTRWHSRQRRRIHRRSHRSVDRTTDRTRRRGRVGDH